MAELVKILSSFHVGLWGCSPVPLEVRWRLLMGSEGSTRPAATTHGSHSHPLGAKNRKWVEPAETLRQQYLDHVAVNGKTQADVCPVLPASACSQIQIPNAAQGVGLRSVKSWFPHTSSPWRVCKGWGMGHMGLVLLENEQVLPRYLHLSSVLFLSTLDGAQENGR